MLVSHAILLAPRRYPGEIIPGLLYLGAWEHALDRARLQELNIQR